MRSLMSSLMVNPNLHRLSFVQSPCYFLTRHPPSPTHVPIITCLPSPPKSTQTSPDPLPCTTALLLFIFSTKRGKPPCCNRRRPRHRTSPAFRSFPNAHRRTSPNAPPISSTRLKGSTLSFPSSLALNHCPHAAPMPQPRPCCCPYLAFAAARCNTHFHALLCMGSTRGLSRSHVRQKSQACTQMWVRHVSCASRLAALPAAARRWPPPPMAATAAFTLYFGLLISAAPRCRCSARLHYAAQVPPLHPSSSLLHSCAPAPLAASAARLAACPVRRLLQQRPHPTAHASASRPPSGTGDSAGTLRPPPLPRCRRRSTTSATA